jgi:isopentenyl-diphosphate delta-isomerase type 1
MKSNDPIEYLDILNDKGEKTGESVPYTDVHTKGLIHRAVHMWIMNSKRELLLQRRSPNKGSYPNHWDISAAGHVSAGQSSVEAAQREMEEELGLELPNSAFRYLFSVEQHIVINNGTYINNEFNDVYLVLLDKNIEEMKIQKEEVAELKWITVDNLKKLLIDKKEPIVDHDEEYKLLFEILKQPRDIK